MIKWLEKDKRMKYRIKLLQAWKEQAESEGNSWAATIAFKHLNAMKIKQIEFGSTLWK